MLLVLRFLCIPLILSATLLHSKDDHSKADGQNQNITSLIKQYADGEHRSDKHKARNKYRHPAKTLEFFGITPDMSVLEVTPGGMWYTEVLAPLLRDEGKYIAAGYDVEVEGQPKYRYSQHSKMLKRFSDSPELYGKVEIAKFSPPDSIVLGADNSVDRVLTFRNAHHWIAADLTTDIMQAFYNVLKPGGVFGIVQHRSLEINSLKEGRTSGYVTEAQIIDVALAAGFVLDGRSEINANPKDTRDYENGVWTLPPVLRLKKVDKEKYLAIGESDRMTLRFRKL